ncbi:hypothetical protein ACJJTC_008742 [Scirpophaga incertulas]
MSDPLDPGGGDWGDADSSPPLFSPLTDTDVVKRIGRNRISVEFKSYNDANAFLDHPALALAKYEALIPSHHITRMGIVRQVPVEWSLEEIVDAIEIPQGFGSNLLAQVMIDRPSLSLLGLPAFNPQMDIVCRMVTIDMTTMITSLKCFWHRP